MASVMKLSLHMNNLVRSIAAVVIATIASFILVPTPNMAGCPYAGPCHIWPEFLYAFIFVFVSIVAGPSNRVFQTFILALIPLMGLIQPQTTGELGAFFWRVIINLPSDPMVQGGVIAAIICYVAKIIYKKANHETHT